MNTSMRLGRGGPSARRAFSGRAAALAVLAALVVQPAQGQAPPQDPALFAAAAVRFLDDEMPRMEAAVRAGDRDFFEGATERMVAFSEDWDFKAHPNPDLAPYAACTAAVSDHVMVGLCRLVPGSPVCEPGLAAQFARNVAQCRQAAR